MQLNTEVSVLFLSEAFAQVRPKYLDIFIAKTKLSKVEQTTGYQKLHLSTSVMNIFLRKVQFNVSECRQPILYSNG